MMNETLSVIFKHYDTVLDAAPSTKSYGNAENNAGVMAHCFSHTLRALM